MRNHLAPELSPDLRQAVHQLPELEPLRVVDPDTNTAYIIVRADVYDHLQAAAAGVFDPRETYPFIQTILQEDDNADPLLASYQNVSREAPRS